MDERRRKFLMQNLDKAHQAKKELAQLRGELKAGYTDPYELIKGNDDRWEPRVARMEVQRVLKLVPGVGTARMIDVLVSCDLAPTSKLGSYTWQRRAKIANALKDTLEVVV